MDHVHDLSEEAKRGLHTSEESISNDLCVDSRGRPCSLSKHGGKRAALFVLGLQAFEMMAIAAVGNNLITYVFNEMHFPLSKSANLVTNFIGTVFLLSLLGGFLSDSYLGSYRTMLVFGVIEISGFILLSVQAHLPELKPPECNMKDTNLHCLEANGYKAATLYGALCLVALGSGCLKPNIISHGADQFQKKDLRKLSSFFNAAYFAFSMGQLIALTLLVWVQTHSGMDVGFGVSAVVMFAGMISLVAGTNFYRNKPPRGSIFTPIAQVFVAAITKRKQMYLSNPNMLHQPSTELIRVKPLLHSNKFRFLDKACIKTQGKEMESPWRLCTMEQVHQVKILLSVIPIFACTIIFNTILAQLQTFSVQQGSSMNTHITKTFQIPPASLQAIPYVILIFFVPLYETFFVPAFRKLTGNDSGISPLQRIGTGLFLATFSMVAAALVENMRRESFLEQNVTLSIFWIAPQFLIFGLSEMFTAVGLVEFFYKQSSQSMQSFLTAMTYCSYSFGFYLSSVLVSTVNRVTSSNGWMTREGWLGDNNLNKDRLDLFYWLLASLSFINFFNYLFWSRWYSFDPSATHHSAEVNSLDLEDVENGGIMDSTKEKPNNLT